MQRTSDEAALMVASFMVKVPHGAGGSSLPAQFLSMAKLLIMDLMKISSSSDENLAGTTLTYSEAPRVPCCPGCQSSSWRFMASGSSFYS